WVACCGVPSMSAQSVARPPRLVSRPRVPLEGSVVLLELRSRASDSVTTVRGELAGEPLHFERGADGFRALGAVPLGAVHSVAARAAVGRGGGRAGTRVRRQ